MPMWVLIIWLIVGGATGLLAQRFNGNTPSGGRLGDLVFGIVGALLAGYGLSLALPAGTAGTIGGLIGSVLAAVAGAVLLIWIARRFKSKA